MSQSTLEVKKRWLNANKHKRPKICRNWKLRRFYGISPEQYEQMLAQQNEACAICKTKFNGIPFVDHDHSSGWVRGLLCSRCNFAIGGFEEDILRMQEAVEYLVSNATPTEFNILCARDGLKKKSKGNTLPRTEEHKKKLRTARLGVPAWNKGKAWNEETKVKMSESANKRWENATEEQLESYKETGRKSAAVRWESEG